MFTSASCTRRVKRTWFSFRNSWISVATIRANIFKIELNALVNKTRRKPKCRGEYKPRRHWQVVETRWNFETLTGILMASHSIPGFGEFLLSHSHAMYYSPNQWCSVGYVIHNVRFPNLKQISYGVMALRFMSAWHPHRVTGSVLRPSLKLFSGINFEIVHNCDKNAD